MRFRVFNSNKAQLLASDLEVAETSWDRMRGLLGRKADEFTFGKGLWIAPSQGVHTIGMSFPIDVIYLDAKNRVVHLCHNLAPNRIAALKAKARSVIELPAGVLAQTHTSVGDILEISEIQAEGE